jgi:hypothetical protein
MCLLRNSFNADFKVELSSGEIVRKRMLKHIFTWAEGDLRGLTLWDNDEPKVEAFQAGYPELQLPSDFIKIS